MSTFLRIFESLDRRWIYLFLGIILLISLWKGTPEDPVVQESAQKLFDAVERAPAGPNDNKIILLGTTFSSSTMGESANQARALMRHLMLRQKKFAVIAVSEPQGAKLGQTLVTDLAKQYQYEYGRDYICFGYQIGTLAFYKSFTSNIVDTIKTDSVNKRAITSYPIMQGIKSANDIALHVEITASSSVFDWIQLVQPATKPHLKIGYACTGIMAPEGYAYLDSGQLEGMLPGLKGAADYEKMVDDLEAQQIAGKLRAAPFNAKMYDNIGLPAAARKLMFTQNWAHIVMIFFIILGNVGMFIAARQQKAKKGDA